MCRGKCTKVVWNRITIQRQRPLDTLQEWLCFSCQAPTSVKHLHLSSTYIWVLFALFCLFAESSLVDCTLDTTCSVIGGAPCAVRKAGCFSPPVATGPRVLNSAPYSPCLYTRDFLF